MPSRPSRHNSEAWLSGRVAVVTGGARGIGRAVADRFLALGAQVAILDVQPIQEVTVPPRELQLRCDVGVADDLTKSIDTATRHFGGIDVLINNAGVNAYFDASRMTPDEWDRFFAIDLKAAWIGAKAVLPSMISRGGGAIINIASIHASLTMPGMFPYAAAKAGLVGMTRSLALDYASRNVRVIAVCPGWVRTALVEDLFRRQADPAVYERSVLRTQPLGRLAEPREIAELVAFLSSDRAGYITGVAIPIDGGLSALVAG